MDCNIFIIGFYNKEGHKKTPSPHEWGARGVESVEDTFLFWVRYYVNGIFDIISTEYHMPEAEIDANNNAFLYDNIEKYT